MFKKRFILSIALGLCAQPLWAQMTQELEPIVVTATRYAKPQSEVPGHISVITQEDLRHSNASNVAEALQEVPGTFVYNQGTSKTLRVDMRGFGATAVSNTLVLVNGRRVHNTDLSGTDFIQIPLSAIEQIEVIRGAGSVLYGDNAVGGVMNIITKKGEEGFSGSLTQTYGSYQRRLTDVQLSGSVDKLDYFVSAQYHDDNGYRLNSDVLARDINTQLNYQLTDVLAMNVDAGFHKDRYGLPSSLTLANIASLGREGSTRPTDFAKTEDHYVNLGLDYQLNVGNSDWGNVELDFSRRDRHVFDSLFGSDTDKDVITNGFNAKHIYEGDVFDKAFTLVSGFDFYEIEDDITGKNSGSQHIITISKEEYGTYSALEYELLDQWVFNVGTRYQYADYTFDQKRTALTFAQRRSSEWVSQAGLKYSYGNNSNVSFDVKESFRFPVTDEMYSRFTGNLTSNLTDQKGIEYNLAWRHHFDKGLSLSVNPYVIDLENEIYFDQTNFVNGNYKDTRRLGLELGVGVDVLEFIDIDFLDSLNVFANFTYQRPRFKGGANAGHDIPLVPRVLASHGIQSKFGKHFGLSLTGNFVGPRYADGDQFNVGGKEDEYYTLDARLTYAKNHFEVFAEVNNLFDEEYSPYVFGTASKSFSPAPELNYNVGVKVKF